jgi:Mrp family chromosome partitioning ATPase
MSNIYEALEKARKPVHVANPTIGTSEIPKHDTVLPSVLDDPFPQMEEEMVALYHMITSSLPGIEHRSVLFVGSGSNEGTSTIARQLGRTASLRMEKNVLLMDLDRSRPDLHVYSGLRPEKTIEDVFKNGGPIDIDKAMCQVDESSLFIMPLFQTSILTPKTVESAKHEELWKPLKEKFDLIIVDSPPATVFPDGPGLVSQVDGVILVVEAEKTRWSVAQSVKEKIEKSGGRILGIVFNKRKFYIPKWLYKRM